MQTTETIDNMTPREKAQSFLSLFEKMLSRCYNPALEAFQCAVFAVEEIRKHCIEVDVDYWHAVWILIKEFLLNSVKKLNHGMTT